MLCFSLLINRSKANMKTSFDFIFWKIPETSRYVFSVYPNIFGAIFFLKLYQEWLSRKYCFEINQQNCEEKNSQKKEIVASLKQTWQVAALRWRQCLRSSLQTKWDRRHSRHLWYWAEWVLDWWGRGYSLPVSGWGWMLECSPRWESEKCNSQKKLRSKVYIVWQSGLLAICSIVLWMACVGMSSTSLEFSVSFSVTGFCAF